MKIKWRISDDLGWRHQMCGTREAAGSIAAIRELLAAPEVVQRFGRPYSALLIEALPADPELGSAGRMYHPGQEPEEGAVEA